MSNPPTNHMDDYMSGNPDLYRFFDAIYNRSVSLINSVQNGSTNGEDETQSSLIESSDDSTGEEGQNGETKQQSEEKKSYVDKNEMLYDANLYHID